jgi:MoxR-like ATPase
MTHDDWKIFKGDGKQIKFDTEKFEEEYPPPSWRKKKQDKKYPYQATDEEIEIVNASIYLRRPILITGDPGVGKSTLAHAIAYELGLGDVLHWHIGSKSTVESGLYSYDAIARLQDTQSGDPQAEEIKNYVKLNPLGIAFGSSKKRVLLIDEIDKSDVDLPNNLLQLFEDNYFEIDILKRMGKDLELGDDDDKIEVVNGRVENKYFPIVIMTSNNERDFPPAFMRRCLHHHIKAPNKERLLEIATKHLEDDIKNIEDIENIIESFVEARDKNYLSTDQLLNALHLRLNKDIDKDAFEKLRDKIWHSLTME